MGKPRDTKVAILPSTTRKGTTLSTSAALDSPSVISKLVSPPQASNADATIARSRQIENTETPNENAATPVNSPESVEYSSDDPDEDYVELDDDFIVKCNATTDARRWRKLPEAWARVCSLIRARPGHDLEKHDLLDIFYSGLTIESRAYLDSCAGCVFRKRTPDEAEELLAKIGQNHDDWTTPEPTPTPILKKRGMIKLNDEDMKEAKKSLKEKGIKPEDVKNLPPIEDLCKITPPSSMIEYMKDIVSNKRKIPNEEISTMLANYSFNGKVPKKLGDPAIRVPQWGSCEKIRGLPQELLSLYKMICHGRSFSEDGGKISSIQLPAIRYFAYFITKCVLARKNATYRLATNREKGGICGGLIASRLLAMHGVEPHHLDIQLSIEKLDIVSMIKHEFVSDLSNLSNLSYKITFYKKTWRTTKKIEKLVGLPAPVLFNLDSRKDWSVTEGELNAYIEGDGHHARDGTEEAEEHLDSSSDAASSSHQHVGHEEPSPFSSAPGPYYDYAMYDPPAWNPDPRWG
ncbi:hypothetical protein QYE76_031859 [Lolium multiflorum]|uniref:Uncharacterized protein n=1 Tax=Lolium multiflorum TaxID=4521 RepID=A0AAD8QTY6_LOLMU|nr:hypothetical protein QYE76_031859 [Lolium multiflorum]